jgi:hypothetical protein
MAQDAKDLETLVKWLQRYYASENYCQNFFNKGRENYKLYKSYKDQTDKAYKHDIFVPYAFAYLEDLTAYFMLSVQASPITFSLEPRVRAISYESCQELEQIVHWALTDETAEFVLELEELIKNANLFNAAYMVNYPEIDGNSHFLNMHYDTPSTLDVYPEPNVKRLSRMRWIIKKSWESIDHLKEEEKKGEYENVDESMVGYLQYDAVTQLLSSIGISTKGQYYDKSTRQVELLDCMEDGDVITIAGRRSVIRDTTKKKIKPFIFPFPMVDYRGSGAPGEFFGSGVVEQIKPEQKELNTLRSQRRDNISLILNKLFIYDILAGEVDLSTLYSAPGNVIVTTNKEALSEMPIQDVTISSYKEEDAIKYDMQNISSMWDYARGATPRRRETASGIIRLQQAAQGRNEWILRKLDLYVLQPCAKRLLIFLREYLDPQDYDAIIGKDNHKDEFYNLSPDQIKRCFQVMPLTESIVSLKEMNLNMFLQAFDRLIRMPMVNHIALIKQLLIKLGQKNIKDILPMLSPEAQGQVQEGVQQMNNQQAAMKEMMMQRAMMGGPPQGGPGGPGGPGGMPPEAPIQPMAEQPQ